MVTAPDGSPVELYALFPDRGEGEIVAGAVPAGASILELGCGTGRMTRQLVERGLTVTAVDESPEMLEHVRGADGVVHGAVEYAAGGKRWRHEFSMRVFADEEEPGAALAEGGFRLDRWLDRERGWFVATAAPART